MKPNRCLLKGTLRLIKAVFSKCLHENNTEVYHEQLLVFVTISSRVNCVTNLAPNQVKKSRKSSLVSFQICNSMKKPKFKPGQNVRIRRKSDLFHRGYRIQFTEEVFQIQTVETLNPPFIRSEIAIMSRLKENSTKAS